LQPKGDKARRGAAKIVSGGFVPNVKRGRPSDEYPSEEFRRRASEQVEALDLTVRQVEGRSGVNRGTISQVLRGLRHCAPEDRHTLMVALEFTEDEQQRFLPSLSAKIPELVFHDGTYPRTGSYEPIQRGRELLMRSLFPEARMQLTSAFRDALARRDLVRAADAAEVMAWLEHEAMDRENTRALKWVATSIDLVEKHVGTPIVQILASAETGSQSAEISADAEVTSTLAKVLQIRSKLLAERALYYGESRLQREAHAAFEQSLALDGFVHSPGGFGHDFRWQARLLAADRTGRDAAEKRIAESFDHFERGSSGESLVARDRGFVYWQTGQPAQARAAIGKAIDLLVPYADARALGPAFYVLSQLAAEADRLREARRLAIMAAVFHPYGYVLQNGRAHVQISHHHDLSDDIDDLLTGRPPFQLVHQVMESLTDRAVNSASELIERNLSRVASRRIIV
jgi:transcriptional regulator with XRE-family HTH domain